MGILQEKSGRNTEELFREVLTGYGIPNFKLATGRNGTVFDVIATLHSKSISFEIKNVKKGSIFRLNHQILKKKDEMDIYSKNNLLCLVIYFEEYKKFIVWEWNVARMFLFYKDKEIRIDSDNGYELEEVVNAYFNRQCNNN